MDVVRRATEKCDSLQGFQLVNSLGGGCGSGFGTLLTEQLGEIYHDKVLCNFCYLPIIKTFGREVVSPYNMLLSISHMLDSTDIMMFFEEQALYDICSRVRSSPYVAYKYLNSMMSTVMTDITSSFRFPGQVGGREKEGEKM